MFPVPLDSVTALRYVDDLLVISSMLCGHCLEKYVVELYPWKISFSSASKHDGSDHYHRWLDFIVGFRGTCCKLNKSNPNSQWIWSDGQRERFSILPWCGKGTVMLQHMRSHYINCVYQFAGLRLPVRTQFMQLMGIILEFRLLGYPKKFIVGLCVSHFSQASRLVAKVTRKWLAVAESAK